MVLLCVLRCCLVLLEGLILWRLDPPVRLWRLVPPEPLWCGCLTFGHNAIIAVVSTKTRSQTEAPSKKLAACGCRQAMTTIVGAHTASWLRTAMVWTLIGGIKVSCHDLVSDSEIIIISQVEALWFVWQSQDTGLQTQNPFSWTYSPTEAKRICNMNMVTDPGPNFDDVPRSRRVAESEAPAGSQAAHPPTSDATEETQDKLDTIIQMLANLTERVKALESAVSNLTPPTRHTTSRWMQPPPPPEEEVQEFWK